MSPRVARRLKRKHRKEAGICADCNYPAMRPFVRCATHREENRARTLVKYRAERGLDASKPPRRAPTRLVWGLGTDE